MESKTIGNCEKHPGFNFINCPLCVVENKNILNECYFVADKKFTSATICANCGKEKMLHTIGEGLKASQVIITNVPENKNIEGISSEEAILFRLFAEHSEAYRNKNESGKDTIECVIADYDWKDLANDIITTRINPLKERIAELEKLNQESH